MELLQTLFAVRIASPLDVLANVLGAAAGVVAAAPAEQAFGKMLIAARAAGFMTGRARYLLVVLLTAIVVNAWYPFDITLDVSTLGARTADVRRDPWLWPPSSGELLAHAALFFVVAATATTCLRNLAADRAALVAGAGCVVIAGVIDLGQLAMGARPIGLASFASQTAGACAGAVAAAIVRVTR
jgi:VanZ family protein